MAKDKNFNVWIKGRRFDTQQQVAAPNAAWALTKAGNMFGTKTFLCDAMLVKKAVSV